MQPEERIITGEEAGAVLYGNTSLRPRRLAEYIRAESGKNRILEVFIKAAADRKEALDHVLLFGPPGGWGKPH